MLLFDLSISRLVSAWLVLGSLALADPPGEVRWRADYATARAEAARLGRPTIIVVKSAACGWCHRLERTTLRDARVVRALNETTVPVTLDADDPAQSALVESLRVEGLPTVAAVAPDGRDVANRAGYVEAGPFLRLLQGAIDAPKGRR